MGYLFLLLTLIIATLSQPYPIKHLAGPPEEFPTHRVPSPLDTISEERSFSHFIWFETGLSDGLLYSMDIPVDGPSVFAFSFSSPFESKVRLELHDPEGSVVDLDSMKNEGSIPIGDTLSVPTSTYIVPNAIRGHYNLFFYSALTQHELGLLADTGYHAVVTVINNDYVVIESHMSSYLIKVGKEIGIIANIVNLTPQFDPSDFHVTSAEMEIISPDGKDVEIPMIQSNLLTGKDEGSYSAHFTATEPGEYIIQAKLGGWFAGAEQESDIPFIRSTQQVIYVSDATVELTGTARSRLVDPSHILIDIGTTGNAKRLRAYAEVVGVDHITKEKKEVCWIGGVVEIVNNFVTLELDTKWLLLAGASGPLTLQNVYLSDLDTSYPVSIFPDEIPVGTSQLFQYSKPLPPITTITKEMRNGRNPLKNIKNVNGTAAPNLLLLPGYCSTNNPFEGNPFTNGAYFKTGGGNLSNDKFALQVLDYIKAQSMTSFSIIAHSQGGMVGLHLHNYYFTGLESAANGRLIQTVGTPWSGCTAAGSLANLGDLFGIGCGSNNDLSLDGAKNWLSGITSETRKNVHYYVTSYQQGTFFGDYCNLPINLILQWPNDGTTETKFANLDGGQNLGIKQKWCHITGMKYPAQYNDPARNDEMNKLAAR